MGRIELSPFFFGLGNLRTEVSTLASVSLISSIGPIFCAKVLIILIVGGPLLAKLLTPLTVPLNLNRVEGVGFKFDAFISKPLGTYSKL